MEFSSVSFDTFAKEYIFLWDRSKRGDTLDRLDRLRAYCHPTALCDRPS